MMKPIGYILTGMGIVAAVLIGFLIGRRCPKGGQDEPIKPQADTIYIPDTSAYLKPQKEPSPKIITKEIPIPIYVADSTAIDSLLRECARLEKVGDSLQLILQRSQRHYKDSTYDAWVSGIDPRLDSIRTYHTNMIITKEIPVTKKTRWGLGVQGGMGVSKGGITPYVGIGVSYNLLSW